MLVQQIFTPNDTPTVTYIDRDDNKLEQTLRDFYAIPNIVISVSGPSKSGKTVLIKKVIPEDCLITVKGAAISSPNNLWERVLAWMGQAGPVTVTREHNVEVGASAEAGGKVGIPFFKGEAKGGLNVGYSQTSSSTRTNYHDPMEQVIKEIANTDFAVFIDDFHYISQDIQSEVGRQIKVVAESGVKIVAASVPHRQDDVVRSNPELRGRVAAVNLSYWSSGDLVKIAKLGFAALNIDLSRDVEDRMAQEAFGSPQLMQSICLNLCFEKKLRGPLEQQERLEVSGADLTDTLLRTTAFSDFSKMIVALQTGPRTRGTERKSHRFNDGSSGDVYRAVLLAMREDPAALSFSYDDIQLRTKQVCIGDTPVGSSVTSALEQMHLIAEEVQPGTSPLSWDGDALDITDPYFLFFLRCSNKLSEIAPTAN